MTQTGTGWEHRTRHEIELTLTCNHIEPIEQHQLYNVIMLNVFTPYLVGIQDRWPFVGGVTPQMAEGVQPWNPPIREWST